jgi:hypothetical protein
MRAEARPGILDTSIDAKCSVASCFPRLLSSRAEGTAAEVAEFALALHSNRSEGMCMRPLLLSVLFAFGIGFTGTGNASAMVGSGMLNAPAANFSPRVQPVTHQCRAETKCDRDGKNCETVDVCH